MRKLSSVISNDTIKKITQRELILERQLIHSYAIAPGDQVSILSHDSIIESAVWGFSRRKYSASRLLQVEYTAVHSKPSFRMSFRSSRCIVLADSFYVWSQDNPVPMRLSLNPQMPLLIPAVCKQTGDLKEVALIARPARKSIEDISTHEPLLLDRHQVKEWLDPTTSVAQLMSLLHTTLPVKLEVRPTNVKVTIPGYDHKDLHKNHQIQPSLFS